MTQQEIIIIKLDDRPSATKICQEAIDYLSGESQREARLFTKAKIQLLGGKPKEVPITNISFKNEQVFSITVEYPLGNNHFDHLIYYFDGRRLGEEKDIDVSEIFKGFTA
ncbi:MAG: hypothetical protein US46_C0017G0016 [Candidatus Shapirobacteria bacterium GW2011_GWF2_37_20]|nr:MAG: hypothetical protein US46_C0017G0016 [Candidatus Shapirobacteria bacterium GW2011_GWF2_37_20]